jgi:hypothetical protein
MKHALALVAAHICALVFLVLAGLTLSAHGDEQSAEVPPVHDMVLTDGKNTVRLAAGPCIHGGHARTPEARVPPAVPQGHSRFQGQILLRLLEV